jgi:hypothetical protein
MSFRRREQIAHAISQQRRTKNGVFDIVVKDGGSYVKKTVVTNLNGSRLSRNGEV